MGGNVTYLGGLVNFFKFYDVDMVCCQEVGVEEDRLNEIVEGYGYVAKVSKKEETKLGVAIIWKENLKIQGYGVLKEGEGQFVKIGNAKIINVYMPSGTKRKREREELIGGDLFEWTLDEEVQMMVGDWNCVLDTKDVETNFEDRGSRNLREVIKVGRWRDE